MTTVPPTLPDQTRSRLIIDSNVLLLLVVGLTDRTQVSKFKRTREYSESDFDLVREIAERFLAASGLVTTAHILTEVSNLIGKHPALRATLAQLIGTSHEVHVEARSVVSQRHFTSIGLTDGAILEVAGERYSVLTEDWELSARLEANGCSVINLNHLRYPI